jgi:acyl-CoA thioester hydrolase
MTGSAPPLCTCTEQVRDEWIDYNGHLSEAYYVLVLGHATDEVMDTVGLGSAYRESTGASLYTVEAHIRYLDQVRPGEHLEVRSWVIGAGTKSLWIWHELWAAETLRATEEILGLHVDTVSVNGTAGSTAFSDEVAARVQAALVPPGPDASRSIRLTGPATT